jgi:hypothetical protein
MNAQGCALDVVGKFKKKLEYATHRQNDKEVFYDIYTLGIWFDMHREPESNSECKGL